MANTTTKKKTVNTIPVNKKNEEKAENNVTNQTITNVTKQNIPETALIKVKSNVFGTLFYIDPVTKEEVVWNECGTIQILPFASLRHMKSGASKFFTNQLIIISGFADENEDVFTAEDVYKALFVSQYYQNLIDPSDSGDICSWSIDEINEKIPMLSQEVKIKVVIALNKYIEEGILDSIKSIKAFEKALGCDLRMPE